jgi:hypothetical protein
MKISRKPTPPRPTAPSRPSRLVLASLRDGEIADVENISKYVTPELAYVVRVERAKKPRLADRTASPPISLRVTDHAPRRRRWKIMHRPQTQSQRPNQPTEWTSRCSRAGAE